MALRKGGRLIGQSGVTVQRTTLMRLPEIDYLPARDFWGMGYAAEAAAVCGDCAFRELDFSRVCSMISRDSLRSRAVARRVGMEITGSAVKRWRGEGLLRLIYTAAGTNE